MPGERIIITAAPDRCRQDIYDGGEVVAIVSGPSARVEAWCRAVRGWSECPDVDWHRAAGRAVVKAIGDADVLARVRAAVRGLMASIREVDDE